MLKSGFAEQFVEADVLLFIEAERVVIAQRSGLLSGLVCQFSVSIHNIGSKGVRLGRTPGLAEQGPLSDKCQFVGQRYSSLFSGENKNPRRKIFCKNFEKPPLRPPRAGLSRCNITTVRAPKQTLGADWSGLERTSEPRYFSRLYLSA